MKLNSTRGTSTNIYIAKFRNARKEKKEINAGRKEKSEKKIALPRTVEETKRPHPIPSMPLVVSFARRRFN